jgi:hypothetical protein
VTFGWQGFSLDHPPDWGPVSLAGTQPQGYVRLEGPDSGLIQIRWSSKGDPAESAVRTYLNRMRADSKKRSLPFEYEVETRNGAFQYSYKSELYGFGTLFKPAGESRCFFLEAAGPSRKGARGNWEKGLSSFLSPGGDHTRWSLLGLDVTLPAKAELHSKELKAGKTRLEFSVKGARIVAERWGFAEQLLATQSLASWLCHACRFGGANIVESEEGVEAIQPRIVLRSIHALARACLEKNQIELILVESRGSQWRPRWDWFSS